MILYLCFPPFYNQPPFFRIILSSVIIRGMQIRFKWVVVKSNTDFFSLQI